VRVAALLAGVLGSGLLLVSTWALDARVPGGQLGPGFWPRLVLIGLAAACVLKLGEEWWAATAGGTGAAPLSHSGLSRLALAMAGILAYVIATPLLGFPLATAAFIVGFMVVAGARRAPAIGLTALLGTVGLLYAFVKLVYLPFPKGAGAFEDLTLALYRALGIF
jgi:putative tricarboxylic transport membrane protein